MTPTPITDALPIVEAAILAALGGIVPTGNAHWSLAPADTARRLALSPPDAAALDRVFVAQHQDDGGNQTRHVGALGWQGIVVVRCMSRSDTQAIAGAALAAAAMIGMAAPIGYSLRIAFDRPVDVPVLDKIHTRASQWIVRLRVL